MPVLDNPKWERFAQALAKGAKQEDAYTLCGYAPSRSSASRLSSNANILARVKELQNFTAEMAVLDRSWVISRLMSNADRAMQSESIKDADGKETGEYKYDGTVANRALELLGKELGMFVERSENTHVVRDVTNEPQTVEEWKQQHVTEH